MQEIATAGETITLSSLGMPLAVAAIYEDAEVPAIGEVTGEAV